MQNQVRSNLEGQGSCIVDSYKCDKCKDRNFILVDDEAFPCSCREIRKSEKILLESGISDEFSKKNFKNFNYGLNVQTMNSYTLARRYVRDFDDIKDSRKNSIIFMGSVGSGKTHLSLSIANVLISRGVGVCYMGYRDVITKIKQNVMNGEVYEVLISRYKNASVLLIDDLFKGSFTASDINILFEIVNHRYFNNLPMIISCEMKKDALLGVDEGLCSRILEMCGDYFIELHGSRLNYRIYG